MQYENKEENIKDKTHNKRDYENTTRTGILAFMEYSNVYANSLYNAHSVY